MFTISNTWDSSTKPSWGHLLFTSAQFQAMGHGIMEASGSMTNVLKPWPSRNNDVKD